jgi:hypothetical protein
VLGQVLGEQVGDWGGEGDLASGGPGLGLGEGELAPHLGQGVGDGEGTTQEVQVVDVQAGGFTEPQAGLADEKDPDPVVEIGGVGEMPYLFGGKEPHLLSLQAGEADVSGGAAGDQAGFDGGGEHPGDQLVRLPHCGWSLGIGGKLGDPGLEVGGQQAGEWPVTQGKPTPQDRAAQELPVIVTARAGGRTRSPGRAARGMSLCPAVQGRV